MPALRLADDLAVLHHDVAPHHRIYRHPLDLPAVERGDGEAAVKLLAVDHAFLVHVDDREVAVRTHRDGALLRIEVKEPGRIFGDQFHVGGQRQLARVYLGQHERHLGFDAHKAGHDLPDVVVVLLLVAVGRVVGVDHLHRPVQEGAPEGLAVIRGTGSADSSSARRPPSSCSFHPASDNAGRFRPKHRSLWPGLPGSSPRLPWSSDDRCAVCTPVVRANRMARWMASASATGRPRLHVRQRIGPAGGLQFGGQVIHDRVVFGMHADAQPRFPHQFKGPSMPPSSGAGTPPTVEPMKIL